MNKVTKSYRLSQRTLDRMEKIGKKLDLNFQTTVIEYAIEELYYKLKDEDLLDK